MAVNFDDSLSPISTLSITDTNYGRPSILKRLKGSEVIIVGCIKHFIILEFKNGSIYHLSTLMNIHSGPICDFLMAGNYMYSKGYNENYIKITAFGENSKSQNYVKSDYKQNYNNSQRNYPQITDPKNNSHLISSSMGTISKFDNPRVTPITGLQVSNLEKVMISDNGRRIYCGGKGLHMLEFQNGYYRPTMIDVNEGKFISQFR